MHIERAQVIDLLESRGAHDKADEARTQLPDQVDTDKDHGPLEKLGINPNELIGKIGGLGG
jgi:hypothetical protein